MGITVIDNHGAIVRVEGSNVKPEIEKSTNDGAALHSTENVEHRLLICSEEQIKVCTIYCNEVEPL